MGSDRKISLDRFIEIATDPDIDEAALQQYFVADKNASRPFAPALGPNPAKVALTPIEQQLTQGAHAMSFANRIARWRRQNSFMRRREAGDRRPVIIAEGDSWFQFPIFLEDTIDHLADDFTIRCFSAAGDTLLNMVKLDAEYLTLVHDHVDESKVLLFSGAGNDFVGEVDGVPVLQTVVRPFEPGRADPRWYLDTDAYRERLAFIRECYAALLRSIRTVSGTRIAVVMHGYDHAIPAGAPGDIRDPAWANKDEWLGEPLKRRGILDATLQAAIVRAMIDDLNELLGDLASDSRQPASKLAPALHLDLRGTLPDVRQWADELHPTNAGFGLVARKFAAAIPNAMALTSKPAVMAGVS